MLELQAGVNGRADLQRQLDALKAKASPKRLEKALLAGANVMQHAIVDRVPVRPRGTSGTALPPGALKRDIQIVILNRGRSSVAVTVGPGPDTKYVMRWLEFGHRMVSGGYSKLLASGKRRGPGKVTAFVPAHPVMRPAFEASRDEATRAIIQVLQRGEAYDALISAVAHAAIEIAAGAAINALETALSSAALPGEAAAAALL